MDGQQGGGAQTVNQLLDRVPASMAAGVGVLLGEQLVEQCAAAKMKEYDGTIFFCCSFADKERIDTFMRLAQSAGRLVKDIRLCCSETGPLPLANNKEKKAIFVHYSNQDFLNDYLIACPAGERHLVLYSRRFGNGPSLYMSAFMDFWMERDVDILDLRDIDEALKAKKQSFTQMNPLPQ